MQSTDWPKWTSVARSIRITSSDWASISEADVLDDGILKITEDKDEDTGQAGFVYIGFC